MQLAMVVPVVAELMPLDGNASDELGPPLRVAAESARGKPSGVLLRVDEPEAALPAMRSDRRKIAKILISLLSNAYKFTAAGEVSAGVVVRNGWVTYRVQDTGIGIATDAQPLVFDEFRQADGSATRRFGGTGLGLALSRRIVKLLGGEIELHSVAGQGTTVTVELPLEHDARHDAQHDAQHDEHEETLARPRVSQQSTQP